MFKSAESVEKLINNLARLPGIGKKSAARLAFHILKLTKEEALELAEAISEVKEKVGICSTCFNISESDPCYICSDDKRGRDIICVLEQASDLAALEKARVDGDKPAVIIARTVKGKGVSFMEGKASWHGKGINDEEYQQAMEELKKNV